MLSEAVARQYSVIFICILHRTPARPDLQNCPVFTIGRTYKKHSHIELYREGNMGSVCG